MSVEAIKVANKIEDITIPEVSLKEKSIKWLTLAIIALLLAWSWTPTEMSKFPRL